jgi:hypothetical protein
VYGVSILVLYCCTAVLGSFLRKVVAEKLPITS